MSARFIVRLDDACPTMPREIWDPLEAAFDQFGIRPIVGVIPDNTDPTMLYDDPDLNFWERVRGWEKKGWGIALHGLHHAYHPIPTGSQAIMAINNGKSEFVGLSLEKQREIFKQSWRLFAEQGLKPPMFMAPSHTFDENTLLALLAETDIRIITDGHALFSYRDGEFTWIPQQVGSFRWMPFVFYGDWTVCLHPNTMSVQELDVFIKQLPRFADKTFPFETVMADHCNEKKTFLDKQFAALFGLAVKVKTSVALQLKARTA